MAWAYMAMADHNRRQQSSKPARRKPFISTVIDFRHVSSSTITPSDGNVLEIMRADSAVEIPTSQSVHPAQIHSLARLGSASCAIDSSLHAEPQLTICSNAPRSAGTSAKTKQPGRKLSKRRATFDILDKYSQSTVQGRDPAVANKDESPSLARRTTVSHLKDHNHGAETMRHARSVGDQASKQSTSHGLLKMHNCAPQTNTLPLEHMPKPSSTAPSDMASSRVMSSPKLVHHILRHAQLRDILACQGVSKLFRQIVQISADLRSKAFIAPAPFKTKREAKLNPVLSGLGEVSLYNHIHTFVDVQETWLPRKPITLERYGRFYVAEAFYDRASNPCIHYEAENGHTYLQWELRELSKSEMAEHFRTSLRPSHEASIWNMYLCQPPPMAMNITIWKKGRADSTRLAGPLDSHPITTDSAVTERFKIQAWTVREIFDRIEEARLAETRRKYTTAYEIAKTVHQKPDLRNKVQQMLRPGKKTKVLAKAVVDSRVMAPSAVTWVRGMGGMI